jgi:hypothetical protein
MIRADLLCWFIAKPIFSVILTFQFRILEPYTFFPAPVSGKLLMRPQLRLYQNEAAPCGAVFATTL